MTYARARLAGLLMLLSGVAAASDIENWLDRMNDAMQNLNYRGELVHSKGEQSQTLAVVHRAVDGEVFERLWSLDGPSREIVRDGKLVTCILADQKAVVLEPRSDASLGGPAFPMLTAELRLYYDFLDINRTERVAGRQTRVLDVRPRDPFRFGYRLWMDLETSLPLRSDLMSGDGRSIEKLYFIHVTFPESIPAEDLQPVLSVEGFSHYERPVTGPGEARSDVPDWVVGDPPRGFVLQRVQRRLGADGQAEVEHLVYSDGLASVSVFVEALPEGEEKMVGPAEAGHVYGALFGPYQITAVGDVPLRTLRRMARSARPLASF